MNIPLINDLMVKNMTLKWNKVMLTWEMKQAMRRRRLCKLASADVRTWGNLLCPPQTKRPSDNLPEGLCVICFYVLVFTGFFW